MKCVLMCVTFACVVTMALNQGIPTKTCPKGEHSVLYCPPQAEPSCDKPYLHEPDYPMPCDIPQCFCNRGTIRNKLTKKCVKPEDCWEHL